MVLVFIGAMWLIFAPSSGKEQEPGTSGYNIEMPDADKENRRIIGDKAKAYELGAMEERQENRSRAMQQLGDLFDRETAAADGDSDFDLANAVKDSIRNGDYRYSVGGCLTPLIENYIRKYNAECSGEKRQDGFRAALERLGISPAQQHEILHLSADSPRVLEAALKEIERSNGRIRSPLCFLRSRLTSVRTA